MPDSAQLFYQTDKSSRRRCSTKKAVLKNFAIFTRKKPVPEFLLPLY